MLCFSCFFDPVVDAIALKMLNGRDDLTEETKKLLGSFEDAVVIITALVKPENTMEHNQKPPSDMQLKTHMVDMGWKKVGEEFHDWKPDPSSCKPRKVKVSQKFSCVVLNTDDITGTSLTERVMNKAMNHELFFPVQDENFFFKDDEFAKRFMDNLGYAEGKALPITYNSEFDMQSDESFSRIFFQSLGVVLLVKQRGVSRSQYGPFEVDMPLQHLAVRRTYRKYGARVHFSKDQQVTAIYDYGKDEYVTPGEEGWENAKMLAKVTAFTLITAREHLSWTHLLCSQVMTTAMILRLAPSHPIRRLLTVFSFNATSVNHSAFNSLVPENSILHRTTAFEYSGMKKLFDMAFEDCTIFEPFPDRRYNGALQKLIDEGKLPYVTQGIEYYEIVRNFVSEWLERAGDAASDSQARAFYREIKDSTKGQKYTLPKFSNDYAMLNLLSSIIFTVTAYHELIGNIVDYTILPSRAGLRLTEQDPSEIDVQSFTLMQAITASTSERMPALLSHFENFFSEGGAPSWERNLWNEFLQKCKEHSAKVQKEDMARVFQQYVAGSSDYSERKPLYDKEFKYMDPDRFECSVSV